MVEEGKQLSLSRLSAVSYFIKVHPLLLSLSLSLPSLSLLAYLVGLSSF